MKTGYVVEVLSAAAPALPDSCVVCGRSSGEALRTLPLSDDNTRVEFYLYGLVRQPGQGKLLEVRVHDSCARSVRNAFLKRLLPGAALAVAVAVTGLWLGLDVFWSMAAMLPVLGPVLYWAFETPVPMEFWYYGGRYVLVFDDRKLAERVARLNGVAATACANAWSGMPQNLEPLDRAGKKQ